MKTPKTLGVVIDRIRDDPPVYRVGVVWGTIPWVAGVEEGVTPDAAVAALERRMRRLGYEPSVVVFETLEEAQAEGRRRLAVEDLSRDLDRARAKLPEILAGEGGEPDARDQQTMAGLDRAARAAMEVSEGCYDAAKAEGLPPIQDGRIFCPKCGPDYPEAYFTATANAVVNAVVNAYLSPTGALQTWKSVAVSDEGYGAVQCGSCGAVLGNLTFEDLQALDPNP